MSEREKVLEPVEVEVSTQQERERREWLEPKEIAPGAEIGWRSYDRRNVPNRWRP
jgi:hypothetical protein